jgi:gamma-glutamyltranspeptidase/glutathione hydrolase
VFFENGVCWAEESVPKSVVEGMAALGHPMQVKHDPWGGGQMVVMENGVVVGASDPRKDGMALGY